MPNSRLALDTGVSGSCQDQILRLTDSLEHLYRAFASVVRSPAVAVECSLKALNVLAAFYLPRKGPFVFRGQQCEVDPKIWTGG